ncbi:hypothetical protein [Thauera sp.]|uniref:hypothetical protein n=1 Tax=Thauera sp. TaxID=1905334 RepID=UPI002B96D364|nr:hypothetical protein [Thauera sp.]HRP25386.1 hypothetical protein [Thauera sp.]HRQ74140.1 hypothetical protein [Phycisphaerales bacterium]
MQIPLEALAQVYWRTSHELQEAKHDGDAHAEAEAMVELLDLAGFTQRASIRARCGSRVPVGRIGALRRKSRAGV